MIFELPIDHFPARNVTTVSRPENRTPFGLRLPFSNASCLEISKAVQDEPTVSRATFNFGKFPSYNSLAEVIHLPRLSLLVPSVARRPESTTSRKSFLCKRIVSLTVPTVQS